MTFEPKGETLMPPIDPLTVTRITNKRRNNVVPSLLLVISVLGQKFLDAYDRPSAPISAKVTYGKSFNPVELKVRIGNRTVEGIPAWKLDYGTALTETVTLSNHEITARGTQIIVSDSKGSVDVMPFSKRLFPDVPQKWENPMLLRSKGGIKLGATVLWLFSWDAVEGMSEPSGETLAVEIQLDVSGRPHVVHYAAIGGLGEHLGGIGVVWFGTKLALVALTGMSVLDIQEWKETFKAQGEARVSAKGQIYWGQGGAVSRYDPGSNRLILLADTGLGYLIDVVSVGGTDDFVFHYGLFSLTRANYRFPGPDMEEMYRELYVVPGVGIGFVGNLPRDTPGLILSPKHLVPLATIRRGKPTNNPLGAQDTD